MAVKSDYVTGTITLTNGLSTFTGAGTAWALAGFREGDEIKQIEGQTQWEAMVATITSNTGGTLVRPWGGATGTYAYRMRFQPDGSRVTAQARELIELLGDGTLLSLAGLTGPGVIELLPGGGAQVVPKTDLVSGANYDVQVANLTGRAAYDGQAAGFSVLVADVGDGRAAIYSKITNASGNWTAPAYVTGPVGPTSTVPGVVWRGTYAAGTLYAINDGVTFNGSSFRKLTTAAAGTAPSSASPPVNTAAWEVLAARGVNGTGTGDFVGPNSSTNGGVVGFDGLTGKLGKQLTPGEIRTAASAALRGQLFGLTLSNNVTDVANDLDIAAGEAASTEADPMLMVLAASLTKRLDAAWSVGSGGGGRDTGAIADGTWHIWLIQRSDTGVVDALFSLSVTAPTMPASYDRKRRIGSIIRRSNAIMEFAQTDDMFIWRTVKEDTNSTNPGAGPLTVTASVPSGTAKEALFNLRAVNTADATTFAVYISSLFQSFEAIGDSKISLAVRAGSNYPRELNQHIRLLLNDQSQYRFQCSGSAASCIVLIGVYGWIDTRGR